MKPTLETNPRHPGAQPNNSFGKACAASCKKLLGRLQQTRRTISREFRNSFQVPEHLLRLAMNEAEALAWQTGFPQLIFPTLATEKAQAAVAWQERQRKRLGA